MDKVLIKKSRIVIHFDFYFLLFIIVRHANSKFMQTKQDTTQEPTIKDVLTKVGGIQTTLDEVLEAVGSFSNAVNTRFNQVDDRFTKIEANMVTKEYLDQKLGNVKADLTDLIRKEDKKLVAFVELHKVKKVITEEEAGLILSLEPFPQYPLTQTKV